MHPAALVGIGFAIGTVGTKLLASEPAKKVYVKGLVTGMCAKDAVETLVDQAKAEFDDVMAAAEYEHGTKAEAEPAEEAEAAAEAEVEVEAEAEPKAEDAE